MAEDLGEVRVKIEQDGVEEAADQIADAQGESQDGGLQGGQQDDGGGGTVGELLGGISTKLAALLGVLGVISSLKPIQELLSGIARLLSVTLLPFVALINTFLQPVLQKLLRFIGETDLDSSIEEFSKRIKSILKDLVNDISSAITNSIPGFNDSSSDRLVQSGITGGQLGFDLISQNFGQSEVSGLLSQNRQSFLEDALNINLGILGEQSPSGLNANATETTNKETSQNGTGGIFT